IFISFIYNLYTKNVQLSSMTRKRALFDLKEKDFHSKKELYKVNHKHEAQAYSPLYLRLYELLRNHRTKKNVLAGKASDKSSFLSTVLESLSKVLEIVNASFLCSYLEDMLIYL